MNNYTKGHFLLIFLILSGIEPLFAQVTVKSNITAQPTWGPVGYERADYYYLPDIESYYSISSQQFIYLSNGRWVYCAKMPPKYSNYDLFSGYKVVINKPRPFLNFDKDSMLYAKFKNMKNKQKTIRDARTAGYKSIDRSKKRDTVGDYGP